MSKILNFKVIIEQDEDGVFLASVPAVPGCISQGITYEEARAHIAESLQLCLEVADQDEEYASLIDFPVSDSRPRFFGIIDMPMRSSFT